MGVAEHTETSKAYRAVPAMHRVRCLACRFCAFGMEPTGGCTSSLLVSPIPTSTDTCTGLGVITSTGTAVGHGKTTRIGFGTLSLSLLTIISRIL